MSGSVERVHAQHRGSLHFSPECPRNRVKTRSTWQLCVALQVFHSEKVLMKRSWREAEAFCEEFGAHLASFAHIEEENFVNELLHSKFNW